MSEAVLPRSPSQGARAVPARGRSNRLSSLEALERGFALFRSTFAREAWRYYAGAAPLVLCFIPIWVVTGQIRISDSALLMEATLLAVAYMLRVWMVGSYMEHVREVAFGTPRPKTAGLFARAAAAGRLLTWKIILGGGALAAVPTLVGASWLYSACQFASLEAGEDESEKHSIGGCIALAGQWFGGGLLLFLMLFPLWIAVWLNGLILAMILPQLLHSIFGVNTLLSTPMGIFALFRSSAFWLSLFAGAWLALDPIVKCSFVIVFQHLRSRREGDDLRGLVASLPREQLKKSQKILTTAVSGKTTIGAMVVVSAMVLVGAYRTAGAQTAQSPATLGRTETQADPVREARIQKLRLALEEESQRAIYRWHDAEHPAQPTWLGKQLDKIGESIQRAWNALTKFLQKLWPSGLNLSLGNEKRGGWRLKDLRLWVALVVIFTLAAVGVLFWLRRRRETEQLSIPAAVVPLPDLSDGASASMRSEDEWFRLASQLERQGELRLALRAAYFGLLAGLAQREWLTIRRDRTNREYLDEFTRRWRRRPQAAVEARMEIPEKLRGSLKLFDRVWYGSLVLTPDAVATYRQDQGKLLSHV